MNGLLKRTKWAVVAALLSSLTAVGWAYTSASSTEVVHAQPRSTLSSGKMTEVVPVNGLAVTLPDNPHKTQGIELYQVNVGDAAMSNQIRVEMTWLDPQDDPKTLHHGWILAALYYPTPFGQTPDLSFTPPGASQAIQVTQDPGTLSTLNVAETNALMIPTVSGVNTFYVIVSIMTNGGETPPGQQGVATDLQFYCDAR